MDKAFSLNFDVIDGNWRIDILEDGDWFAQVEGPDFKEALHHALNLHDPLLSALCWEEYYDWNLKHKVDYG